MTSLQLLFLVFDSYKIIKFLPRFFFKKKSLHDELRLERSTSLLIFFSFFSNDKTYIRGKMNQTLLLKVFFFKEFLKSFLKSFLKI